MANFLENAKRVAYYDFDPSAVNIRLHATWGMSIPGTQASVHVNWGADQPRDTEMEARLEALFKEPWRSIRRSRRSRVSQGARRRDCCGRDFSKSSSAA